MLPQRTATNAGLRHFLARSHGYSSTMPVMTASIVANCNMKKKNAECDHLGEYFSQGNSNH